MICVRIVPFRLRGEGKDQKSRRLLQPQEAMHRQLMRTSVTTWKREARSRDDHTADSGDDGSK